MIGFPEPIDQKERTSQQGWASKQEIGCDMLAAAGDDDVTCSQTDEKQPAQPFPAPAQQQCRQDKDRRQQVDEECQGRLPEAGACTKYIQGKQTDKDSQQNTRTPGQPVENFFANCLHGNSLHEADLDKLIIQGLLYHAKCTKLLGYSLLEEYFD